MDTLNLPAGLVAGLAVAAFLVAVIAAIVVPLLRRLDRLGELHGPLALVPFALLLVAAGLALAASALGTVAAHRLGVREVATAALAVLCITPVVGALAVRIRYGSTGGRTFYQQIAANRVSSALLVAVLFEVVAVTAFLIGAAVGLGFGVAAHRGPRVGRVSPSSITVGATGFALLHGRRLRPRPLAGAQGRPTRRSPAAPQRRRRALAGRRHPPAPKVYVIDIRGGERAVAWAGTLRTPRSP